MSSIAFCYNCKILFYKTSLLRKKCLLFQVVSFFYSFFYFTNRDLSFFLCSCCARGELPTVNLGKQDIFINLEMSCFSKVLYYIINSFVTEGVEDAQVMIFRISLLLFECRFCLDLQ